MNGQSSKSRMVLTKDVLLLPASAKTVPQEEIDALEAKRIRRLRELGDWRPSSGWQIEPSLPSGPVLATRQDQNVVLLRMSGARQSLHGE